MTLKVNPYIGFAGFELNPPTIIINIKNDIEDFDLYDRAFSDATDFLPNDDVINGQVLVTLSNGVDITASSTSTPAWDSGISDAWGTGWEVFIFVNGTNSARIQGAGGNGGEGAGVEIDKGQTRKYGGGGGGAGQAVGAGAAYNGQAGTATAGGAGGSGFSNGPFNTLGGAGQAGGIAILGRSGSPPIHLAPAVAATLEVWGGGGGGGGANTSGSQSGGNGGGPGIAGGSAAFAGGAAGFAWFSGVTVFQDGPGTLDIRGSTT